MDWFEDVVATWFLVAVFVPCGAAILVRALRVPQERSAWTAIGVGLLLYAAGSTVYNLDGSAVAFPSVADAFWLSLLPLSLVGMVALVRARHLHVSASLWLDGLIGGSVVAAVAAVFVLQPVVELTTGHGWVGAAQLAYPLGDLLLVGFAVVLWGAGGWRLDAWFGLAAGFAFIAVSDATTWRRRPPRAGCRARPATSATPSARCCSPAPRGARRSRPSKGRPPPASRCRSPSPSPPSGSWSTRRSPTSTRSASR